ncbi:MAG: 23S rRNA (guanosine(2251)-2'-O)-methyltransferase RlmB [Chloroflexi bacterium]|nr:23S rRNA (guanosine(2251)-2'-O)-methyltransferase RlmB [Chloroflexota bacterium]
MKPETVWVWGRHPVLEALRAGTVHSILLATGRSPSPILADIRQLARQRGIPLREVEPGEIERLAPGQNTQGVAAQVLQRRRHEVGELLQGPDPGERPPFLLALDQVQDPHNVGALLRTASAAGVQGVIVPERRSAPLSGAVAKVSAGAVSHLPVAEVTNLARALDEVRHAGIWVVGLDGTAEATIFSLDLTIPLLLVIGGEGEGLRRLTRERCDFLARLPMLGPMESLNASVAGSIAMYEAVRQRLQVE